MEFWLFITAVLFTLVGQNWSKENCSVTIATTIDSLIADGYLKTEGTGKDMQILKWNANNE